MGDDTSPAWNSQAVRRVARRYDQGPVTPAEVDDRGLITDVSTHAQIAETLATLASYLDLDA